MVVGGDDSIIVDISDALSERDRVRFTVHTRTKLPQFAKPVLSVVRQHEEFIWLHDCLEDNDKYAGYIIPPAPPKPDFDASREKLQRLGDGEANMTKEEFAKMKQELEAEYLAIFKKTVAMHELFLQRLAAHREFRLDNNFKIFLEYENDLAVRSKSKKERLAGSIQNLGKSLTDFVITTSQVAATTSASTSILAGHSPLRHSMSKQRLNSNNNLNSSLSHETHHQLNGNTSNSDICGSTGNNEDRQQALNQQYLNNRKRENSTSETGDGNNTSSINSTSSNYSNASNNDNDDNTITTTTGDDDEEIDEQYFEKERLFLALYYNSIKETAIQSDKVVQLQKCVADSYLYIAQQLVKLASIEVVPITSQTKDSSSFLSSPLPSLTLPNSLQQPHAPSFLTSSTLYSNPSTSSSSNDPSSSTSTTMKIQEKNSTGANETLHSETKANTNADKDDDDLLNSVDLDSPIISRLNTSIEDNKGDVLRVVKLDDDDELKNSVDVRNNHVQVTGGFTVGRTSESLKQLLLHVSDYFEQARKIETRIASDEDLKLTDLFLYYKRDTVAAQDLLARRMRFLSDYETSKKNLEKARQKGRTQMQYADVIQKQAKENFLSISKLAKQELIDYKQRRVASFGKTFAELVNLELKHLQVHSQLITKCLNTCKGVSN